MTEHRDSEGDRLQARMQDLVARWSQGHASLKQIIGLSDEELYAVATQGYSLFLQGRTEAARVVFEGLVAIDPRNAYYYRALGAVYWRLGEPAKALQQLGYAIRVAPEELSSYVSRAEVYVSQGELELARADLCVAMAAAGPCDRSLVSRAQAILLAIA